MQKTGTPIKELVKSFIAHGIIGIYEKNDLESSPKYIAEQRKQNAEEWVWYVTYENKNTPKCFCHNLKAVPGAKLCTKIKGLTNKK